MGGAAEAALCRSAAGTARLDHLSSLAPVWQSLNVKLTSRLEGRRAVGTVVLRNNLGTPFAKREIKNFLRGVSASSLLGNCSR